jgi:hypothetical protein
MDIYKGVIHHQNLKPGVISLCQQNTARSACTKTRSLKKLYIICWLTLDLIMSVFILFFSVFQALNCRIIFDDDAYST